MRHLCYIVTWRVIFILLLVLLPTSAQTPKDKKTNSDFPESRVRVSVHLQLTDGGKGIKEDSITVTENGVPQTIHFINKQNQAISYGVLLDSSGSMREYLPALKILAFSLITNLREQDEMMLARTQGETDLFQPLTTNKQALADSLAELWTGGGSALLDGIIATADYLKEKAKNSRRVLIVITDVFDNKSYSNLKKVFSALAEDDVQVFTIGLVNHQVIKRDRPWFGGKSENEKVREDEVNRFAAIAFSTGGLLIDCSAPLKVKKEEFDSLVKQAQEQIAPIFRLSTASHRISYFPTNQQFDNKSRRVEIQWQDRSGNIVTQEVNYAIPKK